VKEILSERGLILCGCGKMGTALLNGWKSAGVDLKKISVLEPNPSPWLYSLMNTGLKLNHPPIESPQICILAVKPQMIGELFSQINFKDKKNTLFISIAAGIKIDKLESSLGKQTPIVRVMPNTPSSIKKGVSCLIHNEMTTENQIILAEALFSVVGETIRLETELEMDAVTAISGSGPAYVFYLIETMTEAGCALGLKMELSQKLAMLTVAGAGALAEQSDELPDKLRENVTSPKGTTEAALEILMNPINGLSPIMKRTITAAYARSKDLGS